MKRFGAHFQLTIPRMDADTLSSHRLLQISSNMLAELWHQTVPNFARLGIAGAQYIQNSILHALGTSDSDSEELLTSLLVQQVRKKESLQQS